MYTFLNVNIHSQEVDIFEVVYSDFGYFTCLCGILNKIIDIIIMKKNILRKIHVPPGIKAATWNMWNRCHKVNPQLFGTHQHDQYYSLCENGTKFNIECLRWAHQRPMIHTFNMFKATCLRCFLNRIVAFSCVFGGKNMQISRIRLISRISRIGTLCILST